jgi:hypothetical protein
MNDGPIYLTGSASSGRGTSDRLGLMLQPGNGLHAQAHGWPMWAADNGCYAAGDSFDPLRWCDWLAMLAELPPWDGWDPEMTGKPPRATDHHLFAVLPDVVGDWLATFAAAYPWVEYVRSLRMWPALVAQDGLKPEHVDWDGIDCLFIGGSTDWKLSDAAARLVHEAHYWGRWVHMGRVNSRRRYQRAAAMGVDSVDGTFLAYAPTANLQRLTSWLDRAEPTLFGLEEAAETPYGRTR